MAGWDMPGQGGAAMMQALLSLGSGGVVGFVLGLIGGGGSIVATPLLLYAVGLAAACGTRHRRAGGLGQCLRNFAGHARAGNVRWGIAAVFSLAGVLGALAGSTLGKAVDGERLILLFAFMMIVIGGAMLRPRHAAPVRPPCR